MLLAALAAACLGTGAPVLAHHSGAMFDSGKSVTLSGKVKSFKWSNPHSWIQLEVAEGGKTREWSIEMGSPQGLYRSGWRPGTLQPGQEIKVTVHPARDGSPVAAFVSATRPDGTPVTQGQP